MTWLIHILALPLGLQRRQRKRRGVLWCFRSSQHRPGSTDGDVFTVWTTLTVIADPSELDSGVDVTDLLAGLPNESLPGYPVAGVSAVPEPDSYAMLLVGLGLLSLAARRYRHQGISRAAVEPSLKVC